MIFQYNGLFIKNEYTSLDKRNIEGIVSAISQMVCSEERNLPDMKLLDIETLRYLTSGALRNSLRKHIKEMIFDQDVDAQKRIKEMMLGQDVDSQKQKHDLVFNLQKWQINFRFVAHTKYVN